MNKRINILSIIIGFTICFSACGQRPTNKKGIKTSKVIEKPTYNIYVENSGSMDGYVKNGGTPFQNTVYSFLIDIQDNKLEKSMGLHFIINDITAPYQFDIQKYILKMTPSEFQKIRGGIKSSEISVMLKTVLDKVNINNVSIWISDCVFTPNKGNANSFLGFEKTSIKSTFNNLQSKGEFATVVLQLMSNYNGIFCQNHINQDRPYYIWIVGNENNIKALFDKIPLNTFVGGGVKNFYCLTNSSSPVKYIIMGAPNFRLDTKNPKTQIVNAKPIEAGPNAGKFQFSIGLNLKESLRGVNDSYVLDASNYTINSVSNYTIEIKKNRSGKGNYTHILKLTAPILKAGNVNISLNNKLPGWVNEINSYNAGALTANDKFKTFGIKTLVEGVKDAYGSKPIFEINISVN